MRKTLYLSTIFLAFALPLLAGSRRQSYFTYDDGGTVVRQQDDSGEVAGRVNLPVFPGDQIETGRRGRAELRLADGNVIALDRATSLRLGSVLDDFDNDGERETVTELKFGRVVISAASGERNRFRLDTNSASYLPDAETIFSLDLQGSREEVSVHEGSLEVRTPGGTHRLREGESARVDDRGDFDTRRLSSSRVDDFERWALERSERANGRSQYLDRSLAYADRDLDGYGSWLWVSDYGRYVWRPRVSSGWRPYYYGSWARSRRGNLVWVSDEPWGWAPYHYGRWAYTGGYGWVWLPGYAYAPAWVYWAFGPSYVGWSPAGWYDCYRPYYDWAYRPYAQSGIQFGFGFNGHVRFRGLDLRPWTFVNPSGLVSTRIDRAAMTTDAIRNRLSRDGDRAAVSGSPFRLSKNEMKDPMTAVSRLSRRGIGGGTGKEGSGIASDLTPFFRRDPELSTSVRDRIARAPRLSEGAGGAGAGARASELAPGGSIGRGDRPEGVSVPLEPGIIRRDAGSGSAGPGIASETRGGKSDAAPAAREPDWRARIGRGAARDAAGPDGTTSGPGRQRVSDGESRRKDGGISRGETAPSTTPSAPEATKGSWRERGAIRREGASLSETSKADPGRATNEVDPDSVERSWRKREVPSASDIPRRIIDQIGGARVRPTETSREPVSRSSEQGERSSRQSAPPSERVERPSSSPPREQKNEAAPREEHKSDSEGSEHRGNIKRD